MRPTALFLLLVLAAGCASTPSGGSYEQVARSEVDRYTPQFFSSDQGWRADDATRTGQLRDGESRTISFRLEGGAEYGVLAGCDQDCSDIDLAVRDGRGQILDSDYLGDDYPVVTFRPRTSGTYYLDVSMFDCAVEPCWYAYRLFRRGGARVSPAPRPAENQWARVARAELERYAPQFFPSSQGWRVTGEPTVRTLNDSESEDLRIRLSGGTTYGVIGGCDQDCSDLDLYVYDDQGRELDRDIETDDFPVLTFRAPYSGSYTLRVRMYDCSVNPCYYAYEVHRR